MERADVALLIAIIGLAVSVVTLGLNVFVWNRSGGRLVVRRLKLEKHPFDPMQHQVVLEVVNGGRLPVRVKEIGITDEVADSPGGSARSYIRLEVEPTDGGGLPRTLDPGEVVVARIPMTIIVDRWFAGGTVKLRGWARTEAGRRRRSWALLNVKTPSRPPASG
jgi:hypothetical protein